MNRRVFQIGLGQRDALDIPSAEGVDVWEFRPQRGPALGDVRREAAHCLLQPADFPGITEAIVEGDRVVFAVDANVPAIDQVVAGLLDALPAGELGEVTVLLHHEAQPDTVAAVERSVAGRARVEVHRPDVQEDHRYLAANASAEPIYLNRHLIDADLVVPVIVARPVGALDPHVLDGGVLPAFADAATQRRLRVETLEGDGSDDREASEAAWLLGIQLLVAVIPNAEAEVASIVAGTAAGVRREAEHAIEASWRRDTSRRAELVFACLDGNAQQQSWENVARGLHVARHLIQPGGTIVVTSRLSEPIGRSLLRLTATEEPDVIQRRLHKDLDSSAMAASLILQLRQQGRVLLLSELPAEDVESLGLGAVASPEQLLHLVQSHESCAIVRSAQYCGIGTPQLQDNADWDDDE